MKRNKAMKRNKDMSINDKRGYLFEFRSSSYPISQANILYSHRGVTRGNHYHKETYETFFIVEGMVNVRLYYINEKKYENFIVKNGDEFIVSPQTLHTLEFMQDTTILSFYSKEFDENNADIYTLT